MRKPQSSAFGTRGVTAPITAAPEAQVPERKLRWSPTDVTVHYGLIVKIVIALWAAMILAAMLWL
jgi:hypothetical protein